MIEQDDQLDTDLHNILKEYPRAPLPPLFQSAVLSRIAAQQRSAASTAVTYTVEPVTTNFLELSSALVMGILLSVVLLVGLFWGQPLPEGSLFPINLTLDLQALPLGWISAVLVVVAVEVVLVILAGLHLTES